MLFVVSSKKGKTRKRSIPTDVGTQRISIIPFGIFLHVPKPMGLRGTRAKAPTPYRPTPHLGGLADSPAQGF